MPAMVFVADRIQIPTPTVVCRRRPRRVSFPCLRREAEQPWSVSVSVVQTRVAATMDQHSGRGPVSAMHHCRAVAFTGLRRTTIDETWIGYWNRPYLGLFFFEY